MMNFTNHADDPSTAGTALESRLPLARPGGAPSWVSSALVLVVLVAGIVCGAAIRDAFDESDGPEDWHVLLDRVAAEMQNELDLSESQRADIEQIVRSHQPRIDEIHARTIGEMRAELQQVIEEMSAALTPEQEKRFRAEAQPSLDEHFPAESTARSADSPQVNEA